MGGGTRLKILEAMAAGVPVVSTTLGAEGLSAEAGRDYIMADTAAGMLEAVEDLSTDGSCYGRIAAAGRDLVQRRDHWPALGDALAERLSVLVNGPLAN